MAAFSSCPYMVRLSVKGVFLCVLISSSCKDTSQIGLESPQCVHLNLITSLETQKQSHSKVLGVMSFGRGDII